MTMEEEEDSERHVTKTSQSLEIISKSGFGQGAKRTFSRNYESHSKMEADLLGLEMEQPAESVPTPVEEGRDTVTAEEESSKAAVSNEKNLAEVIRGLYEGSIKGELQPEVESESKIELLEEKAQSDELETEPESLFEKTEETLVGELATADKETEEPLITVGPEREEQLIVVEPEPEEKLIVVESEIEAGKSKEDDAIDIGQIILLDDETEELGQSKKHVQFLPPEAIPRLEETVRSDYEKAHVTIPAGGNSVSAQIREVVSKHLSTEDLSQIGVHKIPFQPYKFLGLLLNESNILIEEVLQSYYPSDVDIRGFIEDVNKSMREELDRIENLLASARAERDEILIKYNALSERFDQLQKQPCDGLEETTLKNLLAQNLELRHHLEEERQQYQKKFLAYREGQTHQAELVQKLHSKVIQYKQKCDNLEIAVNQSTKRFDDQTDSAARAFSAQDLLGDESQIIAIKLDEEQKRCSNLIQVNTLLREQLEAATDANRTLASEVQALALDWQSTREELDTKETEWREEEKSFNNYFLDEHNRLLNLWRDAVQFRREYRDMKSSTERDLSKIRTDLKSLSNELRSACSKLTTYEPSRIAMDGGDMVLDQQSNVNPTELWHRIQELVKVQTELLSERNELETRMEEIQTLNRQLNINLSAKEKLVTSLKRDLEEQEFLKETDEKQSKALSDCKDENRILTAALKDILTQVNQASKQGDHSDAQLIFNTSSSTQSFSRVVNSTVSTIKKFIEENQLKIEEFTNKLSTNKGMAKASREQYQESLEMVKQLELEISQLKMQMETLRKEKSDVAREAERLKMKFESLSDEKEQIERARTTMSDKITELLSENEALQRETGELMKNAEQKADDNEVVKAEIERRKAEVELCRKTIATLEARNDGLKEDLNKSAETIAKLSGAKDTAQQEVVELANAAKKAENRCRFLEIDCFKLRSAESDLRTALSKIQEEHEAIYNEKSELASQLKKLTDEKIALAAEVSELELEKSSIREEILRMEQEKLELIDSHGILQDSLAAAERANASLQAEHDLHIREKREMDSGLANETRKRIALSEEVDSLNKELEQSRLFIDSAINEKERLIKAGTDSEFQLVNAEREVRSLKEVIKTMKLEKNAMEMSYFKNHHSAAALKSIKSQLEAENDELIKKKQQLQTRIDELQSEVEKETQNKEALRKIMEEKLRMADKEWTSKLESVELRNREDRNRLIQENELARSILETSHLEAMQKAMSEKEQLILKNDAKVEIIQKQMNSALQELQDARNEAEVVKEQSASSSRREMNVLKEQILEREREILNTQMTVDKERREWSTKGEKDRNTIGDLQHQLSVVRAQLEDSSFIHEKELKDLKNLVKELEQQRNQSQHELNTLRGKLKIVEESRDTLKKELHDANQKLKEGDKKHDAHEVEVAELKRFIGVEKQDKIATLKLNEELSSKLKLSTTTVSQLKQDLQDSKQKIAALESSNMTTTSQIDKTERRVRELEKLKTELRKEVQIVTIRLQSVESDLVIKRQEANDLQNRLAHEESKDEVNKREIFSLKQKLSDLESIRESLTKEVGKLQRQLIEERDFQAIRERDYKNALEEAQAKLKQLEDRKMQTELSLGSANSKTEQLKLQLDTAEARARVLVDQTLTIEEAKRSLESKLAGICSALRKYVGMPTSMSGIPSPTRKKHLTPRGLDGRRQEAHEETEFNIDVELIRNTLQQVMEKSTSLENEKDDAITQLKHAKQQINEMQLEKDTTQEKLIQAQNSLSSNQNANQNMAMQIATAEQTIAAHLDTISKLKKDIKMCNSANQEYKERLQKLEADNNQSASQLKKVQQTEIRLEQECITLKDELNKAENQVAVALQGKRSLETELQRQKMAYTDKETEKQIIKERCDNLMKQVHDLEEKSISFQLTIDRLNLSLERSVEDESELKNRLQSLNKSLTESNSSGWGLQEKIQQLQKALANSENERRALQEKNDNLKSSSQEAKKSNLALSERIQQLRIELSNSEEKIRNLETDARNLEKLIAQHKESETENLQLIQKLQQEKHALQDVIAELQRALTQVEVEKQDFQRWHILLEKDKSALKQTLDRVERDRLMSSEMMNRTVREREVIDRSFSSLEKENSDLRRRLTSLEEQLSEQENQHSRQMVNLTSRQRQEKDLEIDRHRNAQTQAEKTLELRERAHRQRVLSLEQQIQMLKEQLNQEIRKRQLYIQRSTQAADDMKGLRNVLDQSLRSVSRDSALDSVLLQNEAKKLDLAVDQHLASSISPRSHRRSVEPLSSFASSTPLRRKLP